VTGQELYLLPRGLDGVLGRECVCLRRLSAVNKKRNQKEESEDDRNFFV